LDNLSSAALQQELTVWRERAQRARKAMMHERADRRLHLIEEVLAQTD
jgi:hypothetical protein